MGKQQKNAKKKVLIPDEGQKEEIFSGIIQIIQIIVLTKPNNTKTVSHTT
jgi:hypothetical protein